MKIKTILKESIPLTLENGKLYELRLDTRAHMLFEEMMGRSVTSVILGAVQEGHNLLVSDVFALLKACLNWKMPNIKDQELFDIIENAENGVYGIVGAINAVVLKDLPITEETEEEKKSDSQSLEPIEPEPQTVKNPQA